MGGTCEFCGRPLPEREGPGRTRRFCNATCRSAARRARAPKRATTAQHVKETLTFLGDGDSVGHMPEVTGTPGAALAEAASRLAEQASTGTGSAPMDAVAAAAETTRLADDLLRRAVEAARGAGRTWQEIGDVLGTTRQAAFQRFGRPIDPRTGTPMSAGVLPGAAGLAAGLLADLAAGDWDAARRDFDAAMRDAISTDRLASVWAHVIGTVGAYERMGAPVVHQAGDHTVVDVPLHFEAGEMTGRVTYSADATVAGLYITPPGRGQ
ncbi:DUF3887 domain-containing protein [Actinomadura sp. LD22]|uniref:DUF3887 domain-containing protein n=2 Tax=Actinomadura physcomitrii TaxID=2650748 RepID=A0A6I4MF84_9ACTN|nr:DUF3887 domain-containing protein [Actinomadura physcomitrii]